MKPFDEHGLFRMPADDGGLRRVAVRGVAVAALSQSLGFAIQLIATVVLARLLTPADFGLVAMVTTFSLLLMNAGFNGFTEAIVQREQLDHRLASNLFWINLALRLALTPTIASAGSLLARFYGDARVAPVALAMSAAILFSSMSVVPLALLKRGMQFSRVSANDVIARALSVAVSIAFAVRAFGYWALVAGAVALPLATSIGAWVRCRWVPGLPARVSGTSGMVRFAMNTYGHFATNYCTRNLDNLLVAWFFGAQSLGFYKKAYDLCVLPVAQLADPLNAVAVPVLSRLAGDPDRHRRYILRALTTLAFVGMGLSACLSLVGRDLMLVLLGPQWRESGRIFSFFAPGIGAMLLYLTYGCIHLSIGRADRLFRWAVIELAVLGSLFVAGLHWGPVGVATAWVVACWVLTIPALWYAGRPANLGMAAIVAALWKYAAAAPLAVSAAAAIVHHVPALAAARGWTGAVNRIATHSLVFGALYLAAVMVFHGGWAPLADTASLVRHLLPARRPQCTTLTLVGGVGPAVE